MVGRVCGYPNFFVLSLSGICVADMTSSLMIHFGTLDDWGVSKLDELRGQTLLDGFAAYCNSCYSSTCSVFVEVLPYSFPLHCNL